MSDYLREKKMESLKTFLSNQTETVPCPFCGSEDIFVNDASETQWCCICRECRARTSYSSTREDALKVWNHRSKPRY